MTCPHRPRAKSCFPLQSNQVLCPSGCGPGTSRSLLELPFYTGQLGCQEGEIYGAGRGGDNQATGEAGPEMAASLVLRHPCLYRDFLHFIFNIRWMKFINCNWSHSSSLAQGPNPSPSLHFTSDAHTMGNCVLPWVEIEGKGDRSADIEVI